MLNHLIFLICYKLIFQLKIHYIYYYHVIIQLFIYLFYLYRFIINVFIIIIVYVLILIFLFYLKQHLFYRLYQLLIDYFKTLK